MPKPRFYAGFFERFSRSLDSEGLDGGAEGIRTLDPHVANVVLSQLSYCPTADQKFYAEVTVFK